MFNGKILEIFIIIAGPVAIIIVCLLFLLDTPNVVKEVAYLYEQQVSDAIIWLLINQILKFGALVIIGFLYTVVLVTRYKMKEKTY